MWSAPSSFPLPSCHHPHAYSPYPFRGFCEAVLLTVFLSSGPPPLSFPSQPRGEFPRRPYPPDKTPLREEFLLPISYGFSRSVDTLLSPQASPRLYLERPYRFPAFTHLAPFLPLLGKPPEDGPKVTVTVFGILFPKNPRLLQSSRSAPSTLSGGSSQFFPQHLAPSNNVVEPLPSFFLLSELLELDCALPVRRIVPPSSEVRQPFFFSRPA